MMCNVPSVTPARLLRNSYMSPICEGLHARSWPLQRMRRISAITYTAADIDSVQWNSQARPYTRGDTG
jgi:hypothetical protein